MGGSRREKRMRKRRIFAEIIGGIGAMKSHREHEVAVEQDSGNVFADIGLANPEERLAKADLAMRIAAAIRARRVTQAPAARGLQIAKPKSSRRLGGQSTR